MPVQPSRVSAGRTSADERERDAEQSAGAARQQCGDAGAADVSSAALAFAASLTSRVDKRVISHDSFTPPPNLFRVEGEVPFARTVRDLNPRNHMVHPRRDGRVQPDSANRPVGRLRRSVGYPTLSSCVVVHAGRRGRQSWTAWWRQDSNLRSRSTRVTAGPRCRLGTPPKTG